MASNPRYLGYPILTDARDLIQLAFDYMEANVPGWAPSEGQLDVWLIESIASEAADIGTLTSQVPRDIFQFYGETLFGIPMIEATPASVTSTWFFTDVNGHTILSGTQVGIRDSQNNIYAFQVLTDVTVGGGVNQSPAGAVTLIAVTPGLASEGLGAADQTIELIDPIAWVDHVTITGPTAGGSDAETVDEYLSRISLELQTLSPRPILPKDFAILARNVPGVQRAVCIDGYNPANGSFNNERMVCMIGLDAAGHGVGAPVKAAMAAYLDAMREVNFVINTTDPTVTLIDVTAYFTTVFGYNSSEVGTRVQSAISTYLDPRYWGVDRNDDPNNPQTFNNITILRYLELATLINNVSGVDIVTLLTLGAHGGTQSSSDISLSGVVPLPNPGTILVVGS